MPETTRLDTARLVSDYKTALREWIEAIQKEMDLVSSTSTVAGVDRWERACDEDEEARNRVRALRSEYESALRREFYHF